MLQAQPPAHVFEAAAYSQRCRSQHRGFQLIEQASFGEWAQRRWEWPAERHSACRDAPLAFPRRSIQNTVLRSSDSIRKPSCTRNSCARRAKLKTSSGFDGRFSSSEPRRDERLLQSEKLVAIFFQELPPVFEGKAAVALAAAARRRTATARARSSARPKATPDSMLVALQ